MNMSKITIILAAGFSLASLSPVFAANGSDATTSSGTMSAPASGNAAMKTGNTSAMHDNMSGNGSMGAADNSDASGANGNPATTKGASDGMRPGKSAATPE